MIDQLQYISQSAEDGSHLTAIERVLAAGGRWIQLRIKEQPVHEILAQAMEAKLLCDQYNAKLIINDYPDIAKKVNAFGMHLGLDDMPIPEARALPGKDMCIGGTANTMADLVRRAEEGADYIGLGPFRFTKTKKNLSPVLGLQGYTKLMQQVRQSGINLPVIAIGGIDLEDIPSLMETGIHGVAVSGALSFTTAGLQNRIQALYDLVKA